MKVIGVKKINSHVENGKIYFEMEYGIKENGKFKNEESKGSFDGYSQELNELCIKAVELILNKKGGK